jgi:hypothetical protein
MSSRCSAPPVRSKLADGSIPRPVAERRGPSDVARIITQTSPHNPKRSVSRDRLFPDLAFRVSVWRVTCAIQLLRPQSPFDPNFPPMPHTENHISDFALMTLSTIRLVTVSSSAWRRALSKMFVMYDRLLCFFAAWLIEHRTEYRRKRRRRRARKSGGCAEGPWRSGFREREICKTVASSQSCRSAERKL